MHRVNISIFTSPSGRARYAGEVPCPRPGSESVAEPRGERRAFTVEHRLALTTDDWGVCLGIRLWSVVSLSSKAQTIFIVKQKLKPTRLHMLVHRNSSSGVCWFFTDIGKMTFSLFLKVKPLLCSASRQGQRQDTLKPADKTAKARFAEGAKRN